MKRILAAATLLWLMTLPAHPAPPDYDFILEIAGYVIQSKINSLEGTTITSSSAAGSYRVGVEVILAEARQQGGPFLRLMLFTRVSDEDDPKRTAQVTILTDASLSIIRIAGNPTVLRIAAIKRTSRAAAESPEAAWARDVVCYMADDIASKIVVDVPLDGLDVIASSRPDGHPPIQASAYELGFGWVLQVFGPILPETISAPKIFLIGDAFSMVLSADLIQRLAEYRFATGSIPRTIGDQGLPETDGPIEVRGIRATLARDAISVEWGGYTRDGKSAIVTWQMGFQNTPDGLVLNVMRIKINNRELPVPEAARIINPIDVLIKSVVFGSGAGALFASPLGRIKITTGRITPDGIFIAGRA